jgi:hypothetical protein
MAFPTTLTINLGTEAEAEATAKAFCDEAGVAFTPDIAGAQAARKVALEVLHHYIQGHLERVAPPPVVKGMT